MTILSSRRHGRIRRHGWDRRQCEFFFDSEPVREMKLIGNSSATGGSARTVARHRLARSSGYRPPPKGEMARRLTVIPHSAAPGTAGPPPVVPRQSPRTIAKLLFRRVPREATAPPAIFIPASATRPHRVAGAGIARARFRGGPSKR